MEELQAKTELTPDDYEKLLRLEELEALNRNVITGPASIVEDHTDLASLLTDAARALSDEMEKPCLPDQQCAFCSATADPGDSLVALNCEHFAHEHCLMEQFNAEGLERFH